MNKEIIIDRGVIIQSLINKNNYNTYLEIGIKQKLCFDFIKIESKESLDINKTYNPTYVNKSDDFFKSIDSQHKKWDIIFVDGDHEKNQVLKDINNSLKHLNEGGTIVCHDMCPPNYKDLFPDACYNSWEALAYLRKNNPDLEIYVVDTDYGVGVIKKGKQTLFKGEILDFNRKYSNPITDFNFLNKNKNELLNLINLEEFISKIGINLIPKTNIWTNFNVINKNHPQWGVVTVEIENQSNLIKTEGLFKI